MAGRIMDISVSLFIAELFVGLTNIAIFKIASKNSRRGDNVSLNC
jgi:hypothetical protein